MFTRSLNTPRILILFGDVLIAAGSLVVAYLLRFNFSLPDGISNQILINLQLVVFIRLICMVLFKSFSGSVRHTAVVDIVRLSMVSFCGTTLFGITNVFFYQTGGMVLVPFSVLIIDLCLNIILLTSSRIMVKYIWSYNNQIASRYTPGALIFGLTESSIVAARAINEDPTLGHKVVGFIDDDPNIAGKSIAGIRVYNGKGQLQELLLRKDVHSLFVSDKIINQDRLTQVVDLALASKKKVLRFPNASNWINGNLSVNQIRHIEINELLERDPIQLDYWNINNQLSHKVILVTGAAGSIGSEIVRQLVSFKPSRIILVDSGETPLYELQMELCDAGICNNCEFVVGNIRNEQRMRDIFMKYAPEVVFHAAAYKHVPMMESNPSEALHTNIIGSCLMADLAHEFRVSRFIFVSTDKAVNPTSVMGASKRIAEMYIQALNHVSDTTYVVTRFGNVMGSNGSVIPRFRKQIEQRKPITVTHPEITRFFMTIPEACQLVLEAAAMGNGGEIYVFDMGKPVRIVDLARRMILLSGLEPDKDIPIQFVGLRPGEKLYEEILADSENTIQTHHPKIFIAKVAANDLSKIKTDLKELSLLLKSGSNYGIVMKMKEMVPEFTQQAYFLG